MTTAAAQRTETSGPAAPVGSAPQLDVPPGLAGVAVAATRIGDVRGLEGFYHYGPYSAVELAQQRSFEDICFLVLTGELPDAAEAAAFAERLAGLRELPDELRAMLPAIAAAGPEFRPLPALRTALSQWGALTGVQPLWGSDPADREETALRVCAITPVLLAELHRLRTGAAGEPVPAQAWAAGTAAGWLSAVTGSAPPAAVAAVDAYLGCTVDHGFNASTFTARTVASSGSDLVSAVCGAIGTFLGPLHGGAPDRALEGLDAIGTVEHARDWVRDRVAAGERIMGFGHAVYRTEDPRAVLLREIGRGLGGPLIEFAATVEQEVVAALAELKPDRELHANVELYAGVVMEQCGIPRAMFTPTFTVSRMVGWCAHVLEQARERKIIRPAARYVGPPPPVPVPAR